MKETSLQIKKVSLREAPVLTEVARRTFFDAYSKDNTAENMRLYLDSNFTVEIQEQEILDETKKFFLAYNNGEPCGYGAIRKFKAPECVSGPNPVELYKMYVDQNVLGIGASHGLMEACLAEAKSLGFQTIWLGVWEKAERARSFYKKWKFKDVGNSVYQVGNETQPDIIMALSI